MYIGRIDSKRPDNVRFSVLLSFRVDDRGHLRFESC